MTIKQQIATLLQDIAKDACAQDDEALLHLLTGLREKQLGQHNRYINAALRMTGEYFADYSLLQMPNSPIICNTINMPHGGALATLADAAMGGLASRSAPKNKNIVTTQLNINYIATTTNATLFAKGFFVHQGSKTFVMRCEIFDSTKKLLATASASFIVITRRPL